MPLASLVYVCVKAALTHAHAKVIDASPTMVLIFFIVSAVLRSACFVSSSFFLFLAHAHVYARARSLFPFAQKKNNSFVELGIAVMFPAYLRRIFLSAAAAGAQSINGSADGASAAKSKKKKFGKASIARLARLSKPELKYIIPGFFMLLASSATSIIAPMFFGRVVDAASGDHKSMTKLNLAVLWLGVIYIVGAVFSALRAWLFELAGQSLVARLRKMLFESIVKQEVAFFDTNRTGELTNRLSSDTQVVQNAATVNISMLLRYLVQIIGSIAIMMFLSWKLTLVLLSVVPPVAIGAVSYG